MPHKDPVKKAEYFRKYYLMRKDDPAYRAVQKRGQKSWRQRNKSKIQAAYRAWDLKKNYGLTLEEFDQMFENQEGLCAICSKLLCRCKGCSVPRSALRPNIDHNHETGEVRGILCRQCNTGIALLHESGHVLKSAALYLGVA